MLNPGFYSLSERAITTAISEAQTPILNLDGMTAVTVQARLVMGTGGTSAKAFVQTSLDQGNTWIDIACFAFTTTGAVKVMNASGLTPRTTPITPTDGALSDDTVLDGVLGDRLRVKVVTTGTYSNAVVSVRAVVR